MSKFIDKDQLTNFIIDQDKKIAIIKNLSAAEKALYNHQVCSTEFLDPYEKKVYCSILNSMKDELGYYVFGEKEGFERQIITVFPVYKQFDEIEQPFEAIEFVGGFQFRKITHKDCLGALMSLGITREKTGDIYVHEEKLYIIIQKTLVNYVLSNLEKIATIKVQGKVVPIESIEIKKPNLVDKFETVSSLRLDILISKAYNLPRGKSQSIIKSGFVRVDYEPINSPSYTVSQGSMISVRKFGRFILKEELNITKKNKIRVVLAYYE